MNSAEKLANAEGVPRPGYWRWLPRLVLHLVPGMSDRDVLFIYVVYLKLIVPKIFESAYTLYSAECITAKLMKQMR